MLFIPDSKGIAPGFLDVSASRLLLFAEIVQLLDQLPVIGKEHVTDYSEHENFKPHYNKQHRQDCQWQVFDLT